MELPDNKQLTGLGLCLLVLVLLIIILRELQEAAETSGINPKEKTRIIRRIGFMMTGWLIYLALISMSGMMNNFGSFPPRMVIMVVIPALIVMLYVILSGRTDTLLRHISPQFLISIQLFRVAVELLIWAAFRSDLLPVQMTFEGWNFDILAGLTAPIAASYAMRNGKLNRKLILYWNLAGLLLLLNIVSIAILSFPTPLRIFMNDPSSSLVTGFPWVYLPGVLVVIAYTFHGLSLRQLYLFRERSGESSN